MRKTIWTTLLPALALSLAGVFLSTNLLSSHIGGKAGGLLAGMCGDESKACDKVLTSRWAVFPPAPPEDLTEEEGGPEGEQAAMDTGAVSEDYDLASRPAPPAAADVRVPVALLGLCYFCFVAVWLLFVGRPSWDRRWWHLLPMLCCLAGWAMSAWFIVVMARHIGVWCPLCLATHGVNFALGLFVLICWPVRPAVPAPVVEAAAGMEDEHPAQVEAAPADAGAATTTMTRPHPSFRLALTAVVLGAAVCAAVWQFSNTATLRAENDALAEAVEELRGDADLALMRHFYQEKKDIRIRRDDPLIPARPGKRMTVVLFSDLQCPFCLGFEKKLAREILPLFEGHLRVVYKHYPICQECNRFAKTNMHPLACEAAYLAEAARLQGGSLAFWRIKGRLRPRAEPWTPAEVTAMAEAAGVDPARLERDRHSEAVKARVRRDIELAKSLGVDETPAVFLNGRLVAPLSRDLIGFWKRMAETLKLARAVSGGATPKRGTGGERAKP